MDRPLLALDIGGTKCVASVAMAEGRLLGEERRAPVLRQGASAFLAGLADQVDVACTQARVALRDVAAVGIAAPGPLELPPGRILDAPNLPGVGVADVAPFFRERLNRDRSGPPIPVWIENDANCGALAEGLFGAGRGIADFVYLTMSTGIGGGAVAGGRLLRGASGNAAELGHLVVDPEGPLCGCGKRGCLEALAGGLNLARRIAADPGFARSSMPALAAGAPFEARHFFAAARAGDPLARRFLAEFIRAVALGIANLVFVFDPRRVILGTMAVHAGDLFLEDLRREVAAQVWPVYRRHLEIVPAQSGDDVALLGPLALALCGGDLTGPLA